MKILYKGPQKDIENLKTRLVNGDFEFVFHNADFELKEVSFSLDSIIGEMNSEYKPLHYTSIVYVESFGHNIVCHTTKGVYKINEKLYEVEGLFESYGFSRVHKSFVVNRNHIKSIIPMINRKLKLVLSNDKTIEVSRKYYYDFKKNYRNEGLV